ATDVTKSACPWRGSEIAVPVSASQNLIVLSSEPETTCFPSGENATDVTLSVCLWRGSEIAVPVSASQNLIVLSQEPETTCFPSGENATHETLVCPSQVRKCFSQ